ncbi:MAG: YbcC family protein [Methylovulum sp.]
MTVNPGKDKQESPPFDLNHAIERCAHWLPIQGPIKDFVHHNTLHSVQHYPFHQGVAIAARIYGARSYLTAKDYQTLYQDGRITEAAIDWALKQSANPTVEATKLRASLFVTDNCEHYPPTSLAQHGIRNHWLSALEIDLNSLMRPIMFRLLGNFLDQGISRWTLAKDNESFWSCIWRLSQNSFIPLYPFDDDFAKQGLHQTPDEAIMLCLKRLVGKEELYEQYLLELLLTHPGWSGMVRLIELTPSALLEPRIISLKEALAVELLAEVALLRKKFGQDFINIAQLGHTKEIPLLSDYETKIHIPLNLKIWHEAMEFSLHSELLLALATQNTPTPRIHPPSIQALFCIDDRECSLRRYLESSHPDIETFGAAGFFGIDFLFQGFDDAYPVAQCPAILKPKHLIKESPIAIETVKKNKLTAGLSDLHIKPHSLFRGWLYTQIVGIGYAARMLWDVFRPNSQLLKIKKLSEVQAHTQLHLLREHDEPTEDGKLLGFTFTEMADKIEKQLRTIGLTTHFAPLIVIVAHGSSSTNNPHFAAYDCGACAGKPGAPNARAFAWMANHPSVRDILAARKIVIPATSFFIAALHNTSRDEITYLDQPLIDAVPKEPLHTFKQAMQQALQKNASERCRWFELAPHTNNHGAAHEHVMARAASIFEPRPELNHSNNLYCIVGQRALTRQLFLDRRAFLHSYDPSTDTDGQVLANILGAVIPVCGGINLEYLFSRIDNAIYGAGTKLPHNVIGLLGVANGVEGDLRTGLPSQMIEVHEPARLLIVIEQTTALLDKALAIIDPALKEWLDNAWVRLATYDPYTHKLAFYHASGWEALNFPEHLHAPVGEHSQAIIAGRNTTIPVHILRSHA